MYAFRRVSCPNFFHPSTNRRMYKLLSKGLIGVLAEYLGLRPGYAYYDVYSHVRPFPQPEPPATSSADAALLRRRPGEPTTSSARHAEHYRSSRLDPRLRLVHDRC